MACTNDVVIVGGSYAGVSVAHYLMKHAIPTLQTKSNFRIILISNTAQVFCRPASPRALISEQFFDQGKLFIDITKLFEQYPSSQFEFIQGTVTDLDDDRRTIAFVNHTGFTIDELHLRNTWEVFRKALPNATRIVIAGGGPSAIEVAGELGEHLNGRPGMLFSKTDHPKVQITVVSSASGILPQLRTSIARTAETYLAQLGVEILKGSAVEKVLPESAGTIDVSKPCQVSLVDGRTLEADLYIPAYGTVPNTQFMPRALLEVDGRVRTNPKTFRVDNSGPRMYAIGDVSSCARPAIHLTLAAVPILASNIRRDLLLSSGVDEAACPADREYAEDKTETQLVPIGRSKGVGAFMGYRIPSFFVWLIKGRDYWLWTTGNLWSGKQWNKEK